MIVYAAYRDSAHLLDGKAQSLECVAYLLR